MTRALTLMALVAVLAAPVAHAAEPARRRLEAACDAEGRDMPERPRLVFAAGPDRAAAANALAAKLELRLERVDFAEMIPKYIGETEKNLRRVLTAAEDSGVVLFFDEADALFGERTPPVEEALKHLTAPNPARLVIIGLRERPVVGSLAKRPMAALPAPPAPPWAAVCGKAR